MTAETDDRAPIIYLRDVAFSELECLLQFIYSGKTSVPGAELASFLGLARGLGVRGFTEGELSSPPGKRKIEEGLLKHTVSEPVYPSGKPGKLFSAVVIFHGHGRDISSDMVLVASLQGVPAGLGPGLG